MAGSVNKVTILGTLGRDPESRTLGSGGKVVNLSVATSETWNDKASGERKERTEWHRVVIWNERIGDVAERFLKKGSKVYLEGALETRKYTDQSGGEKYTTEVVIRPFKGELTLVDSANRGESNGGGNGGGRPTQQRPAQRPAQQQGGGSRSWDAPKGGDLDDEIPF